MRGRSRSSSSEIGDEGNIITIVIIIIIITNYQDWPDRTDGRITSSFSSVLILRNSTRRLAFINQEKPPMCVVARARREQEKERERDGNKSSGH